jgi:hypothetical protein
MEKLEPKRDIRSPISSLNFQRKSDYKKFRKFIKKETEELKGIKEPKQDKLKSILKVGVGGLGLLSVGALIGAKNRFDKRDREGGEGGNFPFAIGKKNYPDPSLPTLAVGTPKPKTPLKPKFPRGTRTTALENRAKIDKTIKKSKGKTITKEFYKKKGELSKVGKTVEKKIERGQKGTGSYKRGIRNPLSRPEIFSTPDPTPEEIKAQEKILKQYQKNQKIQKRITNVANKKYIRDSKKLDQELKKSGSSKRVMRPKKLFDIAKKVDDLEMIEREAVVDTEVRKLVEQQSGTKIRDFKPQRKLIKDRFTNRATRPGVETFSKPNPFKRFNVADNPMLSKNPYKGGFFSRTFKSKVTRDTIMGIPTKGKYITKAGMFFKHPIVSGVSFLLTGYEAFQEGKSIVNFKDNLFTRLYDLGVAINNELIHPDDPSKMKLFISESSNDKQKKADIMKNVKILELRRQQAQKTSGGNNVIVVPENKQNNQVPTNVPIKKGADKISFVPFEPVNSVGTDILLHKLNQ